MIVILLIFTLAAFAFYQVHWKRRGLPPGPAPYPILGNFPQISKYGLEDALVQFQKQYGDIYTIWFGETPKVFVCDVPTINDTFIKDGETYAWRPVDLMMTRERTQGKYGLVFNDGHMWKHHRRASLQVLRDFGMGKNLMQEKILDEVQEIVSQTRQELQTTQVIGIQNKVDMAVGSIINNLLFGYRFDASNAAKFDSLKKALTFHIRTIGQPLSRVINFNPLLFKITPRFLMKDYYKGFHDLQGFFFAQIKAHKAKINLDSVEDSTDYVEDFLRRKHKAEAEGDTETYSDEQLFGACVDLWLAGQETTSNTIGWAILYLMRDQACQERLHNELDAVINSDRFITVDDKTSLPYLNAVVGEVQRMCNLVPMNLPHRTIKDVNIHGYSIPADTVITHNIGTVMRDPRYFPEPEKFKPERFLDAENKFFQPQALMPFGVGKRACLGEGLARLELFLFVGNMFNHFKFEVDPQRPPDMSRHIGGTVSPNSFVCKVTARF